MQRAFFALILGSVYGLLWATGHMTHEILGVLMGFLLLGHILSHSRWFRGLLHGSWGVRRQFMVVGNMIFLVVMVATILTGIMYSRDLFPYFPWHQADKVFKSVHKTFAYIGLFWLGWHTFWHWRTVAEYIQKIMRKDLAKNK